MAGTPKYTIFKTRWGYFGLAATKKGLLRTHLPLAGPENIELNFSAEFDGIEFDKNLLKELQQQIVAYFEGIYTIFDQDLPLVLSNGSEFKRAVLTACRAVPPGQIVSYSRLAEKVDSPRAFRAVATVMAKNPFPLIVPCHRVIRADGSLGGFSAQGGIGLKKKLLNLERRLRNR